MSAKIRLAILLINLLARCNMKLTAAEQKSIQRFCDENNCKPALSVFPSKVNFTNKETGNKITKTLMDLVNHHRASVKEESEMAKNEKKRNEQESAQESMRRKIYGDN